VFVKIDSRPSGLGHILSLTAAKPYTGLRSMLQASGDVGLNTSLSHLVSA
jgi:hypothetical protein